MRNFKVVYSLIVLCYLRYIVSYYAMKVELIKADPLLY